MNWPQLSPKVRDTLTAMAAMLGAVSVALWRVGKPAVMLVLKALLALIVIFEEWGWEPLAALMARLGRLRPWALAEAWVAALPPYAALVVFVLPGALLFPFKLVAIWLLAGGHVLLAGVTFVLAKLVGTAFLARIFMLTKPALMQIGWFERTYHRFIPWKDAAEGWLRKSWAWRAGRVVKYRATKWIKAMAARLRPQAQAAWKRGRPFLHDTWDQGRVWARELWVAAREVSEAAWRRLFGRGHF